MEQKEYLDYDGLKRYHNKLMKQAQLESISIESMPTKLTYSPGDLFDPSGMIVKATYSDGTVDTITDYAIIPEIISNNTENVLIRYDHFGSSKSVSIPIKVIHIYGVEWDWENGNSTKGVRTDAAASFSDPNPAVNNGAGSSPFDDLYPWSGLVKENRVGGVEVKEPKYWFKWTKTGKNLKLQIADGPVEGFHVDPVNMDHDDGLGELDFSYIGRYHCAADTYKSETNKMPKNGISRSEARIAVHNFGDNFWQIDFAQMWYVGMLYLVEFSDWNGQKTIGFGGSDSRYLEKNGMTDAMQYHTGTTAIDRDTNGNTQYRNIEGWWDNVCDFIEGCYYNSNGLNVILNPNEFSDSENGTPIGMPVEGFSSDFAIPTQKGLEWALYPISNTGSSMTYTSDSWGFHVTVPCLSHGGYYYPDNNNGPFHIMAVSGISGGVGCRLQERPPKEVQA